MGNGTPLRLNRDTGRQGWINSIQNRRSIRLGIDVPLVLIVCTLSVFGIVMVYSASWDYSMTVLLQSPNYMFTRQLMFMALGIGVASILTFFDYHRYKKLAIFAMAGTILLLLIVLVVNEVINNAARTIFEGSGQPSEVAKLVVVIYLSVWLSARRDQLSDVSFGLIPLGFILGILGGLIFAQPDLSAATTIFLLGGLLFFLAGGDLRQIAFLLILGLIVGFIVFRFHPTGSQRVADYLVSIRDLTQAPMHLSRSLEALVKGGWFGVGIGRADTKLTGLPVPPTDSIFAVVGEETGLVGTTTVVILYIVLMWRGLKIAQRAPDGLGRLLAAGLSLWLATEAFINMAVIVGLVPFAGNALPFISAGGSSLLVSMAAVGILLNISRVSTRMQETEEKTFDSVVDMRWRDRRWGVSRAGRPSSASRR